MDIAIAFFILCLFGAYPYVQDYIDRKAEKAALAAKMKILKEAHER